LAPWICGKDGRTASLGCGLLPDRPVFDVVAPAAVDISVELWDHLE
jgi:hypothetical protein